MSTTVSVILPVYNVEKYLGRCLDSIINNTYKNLEIICVDDGSTDNCLQILNEYALKDDRIVVISQENRGVSGARNSGLEAVSGDYIAFIDPDDWIDKHYFEYLIRPILEDNLDMTICSHQNAYENDAADKFKQSQNTGQLSSLSFKTFSARELLRSTIHYNYATRKIIRASLIGQLRFDPIMIVEDAPFMFTLLNMNLDMKCGLADAPLYYYYQRTDSLFHQLDPLAYYQLAVFFNNAANGAGNKDIQAVAYEKSIKHCLNYRYYGVDFYDIKDIKKRIKPLYLDSLRHLQDDRSFSKMKCRIYMIFLHIPYSYRMFRIYNDPTLFRWEMRRLSPLKKRK